MSIEVRWRIVEMAPRDEDALDLVGPAFIELRDDDQGSFRFIAVAGWKARTRWTPRVDEAGPRPGRTARWT